MVEIRFSINLFFKRGDSIEDRVAGGAKVCERLIVRARAQRCFTCLPSFNDNTYTVLFRYGRIKTIQFNKTKSIKSMALAVSWTRCYERKSIINKAIGDTENINIKNPPGRGIYT